MRIMLIALIIVTTLTSALFAWEADSTSTPPDKFVEIFKTENPEAAYQFIMEYKNSLAPADSFKLKPFIDRAVKIYTGGNKNLGLEMVLTLRKVEPENISANSVLGQLYWYMEDRENSIKYFQETLKQDSTHKEAKIYMKKLFFVPTDFTPPTELITEHFTIRPINSDYADMDLKALMNNIPHLQGTFGPGDTWPAGVTLEENKEVLGWHAEEFQKKIGFVYTVLNPAETEVIGCVYFYPSRIDGYDAESISWLVKSYADKGLDESLHNIVDQWLLDKWPFETIAYPGHSISWEEFLSKL